MESLVSYKQWIRKFNAKDNNDGKTLIDSQREILDYFANVKSSLMTI